MKIEYRNYDRSTKNLSKHKNIRGEDFFPEYTVKYLINEQNTNESKHFSVVNTCHLIIFSLMQKNIEFIIFINFQSQSCTSLSKQFDYFCFVFFCIWFFPLFTLLFRKTFTLLFSSYFNIVFLFLIFHFV